MKPRKPTQQELEDIFRPPYPKSSEVTKVTVGILIAALAMNILISIVAYKTGRLDQRLESESK